jgi:hypothetical protein
VSEALRLVPRRPVALCHHWNKRPVAVVVEGACRNARRLTPPAGWEEALPHGVGHCVPDFCIGRPARGARGGDARGLKTVRLAARRPVAPCHHRDKCPVAGVVKGAHWNARRRPCRSGRRQGCLTVPSIASWIFAVRARCGNAVAAKAAARQQGGWHRHIGGTGARRWVRYRVLPEIFAFGGPGLAQGLAPDASGLGDRRLAASSGRAWPGATAAAAMGCGANQPWASRRDSGVRGVGGGGCDGGHRRSLATNVSQTVLYGDAHRCRLNRAAQGALSPQPERPRRDAGCRRSAWSRGERDSIPRSTAGVSVWLSAGD